MTIPSSLFTGVAVLALAVVAGCSTSERAEVATVDPRVAAYSAPMGVDQGMPSESGFQAEAGAGAGSSFADSSSYGYGATVDEGYAIPAVPTDKIDPQYLRQEVAFPEGTQYEPGTVVVDTPNRFLYVVQENGRAMRYGIGVGRAGFSWKGTAYIRGKQHWPMWHPPDEMIDRKPELEPYRDGMDPGLTNPLGARALYLYQDGKDTLFRLHGTPEWWTIGTAASSGCIRLINQDILDLYQRVPMGAKVVVKQGNERLAER